MNIDRISLFFRNAIAGYEPTMVRSIVVALFTLLATFGIGSGALPQWVEGVLVFAAFIVPLIAGAMIRARVTPIKAVELPANDYPDGYEAAVAADDEAA